VSRLARRAVTCLAGFGLLAASAGHGASPPPELPVPELPIRADLVPLPVEREPVEPPPPLSPFRTRAVDLGRPPLPPFETAVAKPRPPIADPGVLSCGLAFVGRGASSLVRCGAARTLRGEREKAREALEESLRLEPTGPTAALASLWLAELAADEGRDPQARLLYQSAIDAGLPRDVEASALVSLAWLALRRGEGGPAEEWLRSALQAEPPPAVLAPARFLDGLARLVVGRPVEALAQWERLDRDGGPSELLAEVPFWRAVALIQAGDTEAALRTLERFRASVRPDHPLATASLAQRGWAELVRGAVDAAQRDFLAAEAARPGSRLALQLDAGLARTYVIRGQYAEARARTARLARGKDRGPQVDQLLLETAEEALRRNATAEAIATYRQLRERPTAPDRRAFATYRLAESLERLYRETGAVARLREAEAEYQRLRSEGGDEGLVQRATYWLAYRGLADGRPVVALREGEGLLQSGVVPDLRSRTLVLTAEAAARAGDPNRAKTLYRLALADEPPPAQAGPLRVALGWALVADGEPESALQQWEVDADRADSPVRVAACAAIAAVALRQGHESAALEPLRLLVALAPAHPARAAARVDEGIVLLRAGRVSESREVLRRLLAEPLPADLQVTVRRILGLAAYQADDYRDAQAMFLEATRLDPGSAEGWLGAGLAALRLGQPDDADRALRQARLAREADLATTAAYALTLVRKDDPPEFERRAGTFVAAYPTHPYAGILMTRMVSDALNRGQAEMAYAWVRSLLERQADAQYIEDALIRLAETDYPQPELALRIYGDVVGRVDDRAARLRARLGLAQAALQLGRATDTREALEGFLTEAPADDPRVPWAELQRGLLLVSAQRWDEAQEALEAARASGLPDVAPEAHVRLGELHRARAEHDQAVEEYVGATYLYPTTAWAARGLQGAAKSYLDRKLGREARILLDKLVRRPGTDPQLTRWARDELAKLAPAPGRARPAGPRS
jgi:tetratricopeptide (TPR) repeat protein